MDRLVDYFAVVGCDQLTNDNLDEVEGKVITKIPDQDWGDQPFIQGIELFCQPNGWFPTHEREPPKYFIAVLTDELGKRRYLAVLTFSEPVSENDPSDKLQNGNITRRESSKTVRVKGQHEDVDESMCEVYVDDESEDSSGLLSPSSSRSNKSMSECYFPKSLVIISRHPEFNVFKNCLGLIYTIYIEGLSVSLEMVLANLLMVSIPPRGAPVTRFTIGAADRQALETPECEELPVTRSSVATLLRHLGILNVMNVLTAALVDQKLLFYSCSFSRLSESCNALTALMFPFSYSYPYIPILPKKLLECTSSPTPFLFGVHSSLRPELHDLVDVIFVDLDGGVVSVPECISIPHIPEPYYSQTVELLTKVLCPDLVIADYAYPPDVVTISDSAKLDKEIRAIFLRLFCRLLMGYRSCLQVCRIHPRPVIRFQRDEFLMLRNFDKIEAGPSAEFMPKLLESQAFSLFVQEWGPPYRRLTVFDKQIADISDRMKKEEGSIQSALKHMKELSSELYKNENPSSVPPIQKVPKPSERAHFRENQAKFPKLSPTAVQTFMTDKVSKSRPKNTNTLKRPNMLVPFGSSIAHGGNKTNQHSASARRIDVMRSCVQFIFESRSLETKKIFQAVLRALKGRSVRGALSSELISYSKIKPCLDNQQFEYIARLCNTALRDSSGEDDELSVAADLLPVLSTFYRKLSQTVMQCLYTVVQEHPVWAAIDFWYYLFFRDVQSEMCRLYERKRNKEQDRSSISYAAVQYSGNINTKCLEIAASELRDRLFKSEKETSELAMAEEGVIMGQIQHTAQLMIFLLVPLDEVSGDSNVKILNDPHRNEDGSNSYITSSIGESMKGSSDEDDVSYMADGINVKGVIDKFVSVFVDRACSDTGISADNSKLLLRKVTDLVSMQHESLQDVAKESRSLPPIKKVKLLQPKLLPGEVLYVNHTLRAYLSHDGRRVATGGDAGGPALLPAEGAIFLSNYRVMFIGTPCDALASEQVVIRSFPLSALHKVKSFTDHEKAKEQNIDSQHWVALWSSTFQLLVIGYDDDVTEEKRDGFEGKLEYLRKPATIDQVFAVSQQLTPVGRLQSITSERSQKGSPTKPEHHKPTSKSVMKQVKKKAGVSLGKQPKLTNLVTADGKVSTIYRSTVDFSLPSRSSVADSQLRTLSDDAMTRIVSDGKTLEFLYKIACRHDYKRLQLLDSSSNFRLTSVNGIFSVCKSYPVCAVVPKSVSDENLKSLAHSHHMNRFPCIIWMHPKSKMILMRAGAIRSRTAQAMSKHNKSRNLSDEGTPGSTAEVERFFMQVIAACLQGSPIKGGNGKSVGSNDKQVQKRQKSHNGFTSSFRDNRPESIIGLKSSKKWGTLTKVIGRPTTEMLSTTLKPGGRMILGKQHSNPHDTLKPYSSPYTTPMQNAELYVFVEKHIVKTIKSEFGGRVRFACLDVPEARQVRSSYKSVLKACLPIDIPRNSQTQQPEQDVFRSAVDESGWLQQLSSLLSSATAVVEVLDSQSASAMISLETGWDETPQITSLVQLLSDPYFRTIAGFETLIRKDWLSFGHRFSHRNQFNDSITTGFTPIFIQFLDCVHQVMKQFPLAFEFNVILLQTLAYHSTSNRFNTFLLDSDCERLDAGILIGTDKSELLRKSIRDSVNGTAELEAHERILSLWEYIRLAQNRSQVFYNPLYFPANCLSQMVLRPIPALCRMEIWTYLTHEALADCPIYDGLLGEFFSTKSSSNDRGTPEAGEGWGVPSGRRVVNPAYDNVYEVQLNAINSLKHQVDCLMKELGEEPLSLQDILKDSGVSDLKKGRLPLPVHIAREESRVLSKKYSSALTTHNITSDQYGDIILWQDFGETLRPGAMDAFSASSIYQLQTSSSEERTLEGMLYKRGAYMKGWKQRYFVLDSTKHQLRQYESSLDQHCKGIFDMKEVEYVKRVPAISGAPKGTSDNAFFELKTSKRAFHFIAESEEAAKKWVDAIQTSLEA